jgi:hypothetical protein
MPTLTKLSPAEKLDIALKAIARDADPARSGREVAEDFYERERILIDHFSREWVTEKLMEIIRRERLKLKPVEPSQMLLGFVLPKTIVLKSGEKIANFEATLWKLRQYKGRLWSRSSRALDAVEKSIAFMEPYAAETPGITFGEALALEAKKKAAK